jgi:multiple sugar transport system permease protein
MATASEGGEKVRVQARGSLLGTRLREAGWGYAFVLLPMAIFGLFFLYPLVYGIYISFFEWGILGKVKGVGTQNYHTVFNDFVFRRSVRNIVEYTVVVVPLEMALGLLMALVINARIRGRAFFRSALYFPSIASSAAITAIFIYLLSADGLLNRIIGGHHPWFGDPSTALWSIVGMNAWTTAGSVMLFYLAALQSISTDVYEAAAVDGTSAWRSFWRITFPLLKPAHFFVLVIFGIGALKLFDQAYIVSNGTGGPVYSTYTPVLYIYTEAFKAANFGVAAAAGAVMFAAVFLLTVIQRATIGRAEIG